MIILALDPSGNFNEGKGTTGWAILTEQRKVISCGQILAKNYPNVYAYWDAHIELIHSLKPDYIVMEDFLLYAHKAANQINSRFETPKLIGILEYEVKKSNCKLYFQRAVDVKKRWSDDILLHNGIIQKMGNKYFSCGVVVSKHIRDAIRHGVHFVQYKLPKEIANEK